MLLRYIQELQTMLQEVIQIRIWIFFTQYLVQDFRKEHGLAALIRINRNTLVGNIVSYLFQPLELTSFPMVGFNFKHRKRLQKIAPEFRFLPFGTIRQVSLSSEQVSIDVNNGAAFFVPDMMQNYAS